MSKLEYHHFYYHQGILHTEGVSLERIVKEVGTPTYVYSSEALQHHLQVVKQGFGACPHLICYSVKANSTLAVLDLLARQGSGFDIVSGGELFRVLQTKADPGKIVFSGVGKTEEELSYALESKILMFNVENEQELEVLAKVARRRRTTAAISLRVNPGIDPRTHPHIATGLKKSKFGIPIENAARLYRKYRATKGLRFVGVDMHIGSQLTDLEPVRQSVRAAASLYASLRAEGFPLRYLDVGGGLGIFYSNENPPSPQEWAAAIMDAVGDISAHLIVEPGRVLVGNAGVLLAKVLYSKKNEMRNFLVVDAAMNDLIRPALYESCHQVLPLRRRAGRKNSVDVVGPICESTDVLAREQKLPTMATGEAMAFMSAGAYGMCMSSNFNSRPRAAEVMVQGNNFAVIRQRETYADLVRGEKRFVASKRGGSL